MVASQPAGLQRSTTLRSRAAPLHCCCTWGWLLLAAATMTLHYGTTPVDAAARRSLSSWHSGGLFSSMRAAVVDHLHVSNTPGNNR